MEKSPETYRDLESALLRMATGYVYQDKSGTVRLDGHGQTVGQVQTINEHQVQPNPALIEKMLSERIGGPQDWC